MALIIGDTCSDLSKSGVPSTIITIAGPANVDGTLNEFQCWAAINMTGIQLAAFEDTGGGGSGGSYTVHAGHYSVESDLAANAGSCTTFTGGGVDFTSFSVTQNEHLGLYFATGNIERVDAGGTGAVYLTGDNISDENESTFNNLANWILSVVGSGVEDAGGDTFYQAAGQGAVTPTGTLNKKTTPVTAMGGHAMIIVGSLTKAIVLSQDVGGHAMTITGVLTTVVTFVKAVGGHAMTIVGTLIKKTSMSVGAGQLSSAGILSKKTSKDVGGGSVTSAGTLTTAIMYMQAVGGASMSIVGSLATQFIAGVEGVAKFIRRRKTFYKQ